MRLSAALFALALAGCANTAWQVSAGGAPALSPPAGASASWSGSSGLGALFTFGLIGHAMSSGAPRRRAGLRPADRG